MKAVLNRENQSDFYPNSQGNHLTARYPELYCPRCGSYEIGLRKLTSTTAIWGCKDCTAEFALDFPGHRRF